MPRHIKRPTKAGRHNYLNKKISRGCPRRSPRFSLGKSVPPGSGSHYSLPFPAGPTRAQTCRSIPQPITCRLPFLPQKSKHPKIKKNDITSTLRSPDRKESQLYLRAFLKNCQRTNRPKANIKSPTIPRKICSKLLSQKASILALLGLSWW